MRRARISLMGSVAVLLTAGCFVPRDQDTQATDNRCTACHGSSQNQGDLAHQAAPPNDTHGNSDPSFPGVGAHQRHLLASDTHAAIECTECHVVPASATDKGHNDHAGPATLTFGALSTHDGGLTPKYAPSTYGCNNTYCHQAATVDWTKQRTPDEACGTCHGLPPPLPHPQSAQCSACHDAVVDAQRKIIAPELHVNGQVDVRAVSCSTCHGHDNTGVPPRSLDGGTSSDQRGVGAHAAHLTTGGNHRDVLCADCHLVPAQVVAPNHLNGVVDVGAARGFGPRDSGVGFNSATLSCNSWCHSPNSPTATSPVWTRQGSALTCADCHGTPPPAPHPQAVRCELCHTNATEDGGFVDKTLHINGVIDVKIAADCSGCHGSSATNAAPPKDTRGNSATTLVSVGAHQTHLAPSFSRPVTCAECHAVPATVDAPGHINGTTEVQLTGSVANGFGSTASYNRQAATCAAYCHNPEIIAGPTGGDHLVPLWTLVDSSQKTCTSCHGMPPSAPHVQRSDCDSCHQDMVGSSITRPERHIDGRVTFVVP